MIALVRNPSTLDSPTEAEDHESIPALVPFSFCFVCSTCQSRSCSNQWRRCFPWRVGQYLLARIVSPSPCSSSPGGYLTKSVGLGTLFCGFEMTSSGSTFAAHYSWRFSPGMLCLLTRVTVLPDSVFFFVGKYFDRHRAQRAPYRFPALSNSLPGAGSVILSLD